jgi:hypothetical protein
MRANNSIGYAITLTTHLASIATALGVPLAAVDAQLLLLILVLNVVVAICSALLLHVAT